MDISSYFCFILLLLILGVGLTLWNFNRANSMLRDWAASNGYTIVEKEYRSFFKGPFFWTASRSQIIYRVVIRDDERNVRSGWVKLGSWWFGVLSNQVDIRWDE